MRSAKVMATELIDGDAHSLRSHYDACCMGCAAVFKP